MIVSSGTGSPRFDLLDAKLRELGGLVGFAFVAADRIKALEAENTVLRAALTHRSAWFGTECRCCQEPCPGFPE